MRGNPDCLSKDALGRPELSATPSGDVRSLREADGLVDVKRTEQDRDGAVGDHALGCGPTSPAKASLAVFVPNALNSLRGRSCAPPLSGSIRPTSRSAQPQWGGEALCRVGRAEYPAEACQRNLQAAGSNNRTRHPALFNSKFRLRQESNFLRRVCGPKQSTHRHRGRFHRTRHNGSIPGSNTFRQVPS